MIAHGSGEYAAFDIPPFCDQILRRIGVADRLDILRDDRAFIEVGGDIIIFTPRACA